MRFVSSYGVNNFVFGYRFATTELAEIVTELMNLKKINLMMPLSQ